MRMNQRLELLCAEEGRSGVVRSRKVLLCPSDTLGASDMIDISVPGGSGCLILSLLIWMRSFHLPHIKTCGRTTEFRLNLRGLGHVTDDCHHIKPSQSGQLQRGIDPVSNIARPAPLLPHRSLTISPHVKTA